MCGNFPFFVQPLIFQYYSMKVGLFMAVKKKTKKEGMPLWLCNTIIIALAALLVLGCTFQILNTTGVIASIRLHSQKAMESEHYTMTGADLTYFTYLEYNNVVSYYTQMYGSAQYLAYFGIDTSLPLSQQSYSADATWRDYCAGAAEDTVRQYLVLCEAAIKAGVALDDEDLDSIEQAMQSLRDNAKTYSMSANSFVASNFGKGVKLKDLQKCYELATLADKYYKIIYDGFEYSKEDLQSYYDEHKQDFDVADYRSYTFKAEYEKNASEEEIADAVEKAKAEAEKFLEALKDGADFVDLVYEIKAAAEAEAKTDEPATTAPAATPETPATEAPETTAEPDTKDDTVTREDVEKSTLTKSASYAKGDLGDWLFAEEPAAEGEIKMIDGDESFTVYQVVTSAHRNDYNTVDVEHVYFYTNKEGVKQEDLKEAAEHFLAEFKKGKMTAEALEELTKKEAFSDYAVYNGKLEKLGKVGDDVTDGWLFDDARKENDIEVLDSEINGVNLFLYLGQNDVQWEIQVDSAKRGEDYKAAYEELEKEYAVTVNEKVMKKVGA